MGKHAGKVVDAQVTAANQIYQVAQEEANKKLQELQGQVEAIRQESFAQGAIRALDSSTAYNEMLKHVTLFNIKKQKSYKEGGLNWDEFCQSIGLDRRNVDRALEDISPLAKEFSDKMSVFCGIPFNKIRHLGRAISDNLSEIQNGALVYAGETIPLTPENAEDIQAVIERIEEEARKAKEEAADAKRLVTSKNDVIRKQERDLVALRGKAKAKERLPEEEGVLGKIEELGVSLEGYCSRIESVFDAINENPFALGVANFIALMDTVRMRIGHFRETAITNLAPVGMVEEEDVWVPPNLRVDDGSTVGEQLDEHLRQAREPLSEA